MTHVFTGLLPNLVGKQFLRHFRTEVQQHCPVDCDQVVTQTRMAAQELFLQNLESCPDPQGRIILGLCCLTLAGYREFLTKIENSQIAYLTLKSTVGKLYKRLGRFMFRPLLWFSSDPVTLISKINWKKWNQLIYGEGMEFSQEIRPDRATLIVTRCAFHHFFSGYGEPQLTQVFCAWDRLWMDVIDDSSRPIKTERPTTLSTGSDCCQFQCVRDIKQEGKPRNDVILEH